MYRRIITYGFVLFGVILNSSLTSGQSSEISVLSKEQVVAAYLEKIAHYINWNNEKKSEDNVFTIAVVGDQVMCDTIEKAYRTRNIKGMNVRVVCLKKVAPKSNIDLLLLTSEKTKELALAIDLCNKENILLVTDASGFAERGAHINFYLTDNGTLHFEMNKSTLDSSGFEVDFFLLNFAKIVEN